MRSQFARSGLLAAGVLLALNAAAAEPQVSLTVYSSAQPGGIPAEWYRPLPGMGTPMANLLVAMLDKLGVTTDKLGDSTGPISL